MDGLIGIISEVEKEARRDSLVLAEERFERRITEEISKLREDMIERFSSLQTEMASFKAEIIKWMFFFWVGQLAIIAGLIKFIR